MVYSGTEGTSGYTTGLRTMSDMRDFLGRRSTCFLVAFLLTCLASRELFSGKHIVFIRTETPKPCIIQQSISDRPRQKINPKSPTYLRSTPNIRSTTNPEASHRASNHEDERKTGERDYNILRVEKHGACGVKNTRSRTRRKIAIFPTDTTPEQIVDPSLQRPIIRGTSILSITTSKSSGSSAR